MTTSRPFLRSLATHWTTPTSCSPISDQILPQEADFIEQTEYGPKYRIRSTLTGPNRTLVPDKP